MRLLTIIIIISITLVSLTHSDLFASEGGTHEAGAGYWLWPIVNFSILVIVLVFFLRKPIKNYLNSRSKMLEKTLNEAKAARSIAEKALKEVEERLKLKDKEIEKILADAMAAGETEKNKLIEDGKEVSVKIKEAASKNINYELKKAIETIRAEAVNIAIDLAEKKVEETMTDEMRDKLTEDSIKRIGTKN